MAHFPMIPVLWNTCAHLQLHDFYVLKLTTFTFSRDIAGDEEAPPAKRRRGGIGSAFSRCLFLTDLIKFFHTTTVA